MLQRHNFFSMKFNDKTVWITGASSGIGEALAHAFSDEGADVVLSARSEKKLEEIRQLIEKKGRKAWVLPLDLADTESVKTAASRVETLVPAVDILVHCGGISQRSRVHETLLEVDRRIMEVNFFGTIALTKEVLPRMLARKKGHIVVISSVMGKIGFPVRSAYAASKHALHGFFETLWTEYHRDGIDVTMVCPGMVRTNISYHSLEGDGKEHGVMDPRQAGGISPEKCARKIIRAVKRKRHEVYIGKEQILIYLRRYIPCLFFAIVSKFKPT